MHRLPVLLLSMLCASCAKTTSDTDPFLWLEDIEGERALDWVRAQNDRTFEGLRAHPLYDDLYEEALAILTSDARIPDGDFVGDDLHSFWQDDTHVRGIWRRMEIERFIKGERDWQSVLSIDALAEREGENWVFQGFDCLGGDSDRCLVELSRGGTDESVYREFSLSRLEFIDGGFTVPSAKSFVAWLDEDRLLVATDWGENSLTNSGYPRELRLWQRGTELGDASSLFTGDSADTLLAPAVFRTPDGSHALLVRLFADWNETEYRPIVDGRVSEPLLLPSRKSLYGVIDGKAIVSLGEPWSADGVDYGTGDVVAVDLGTGASELVLSPTAMQAVNGIGIGRSSVFVELLDNVMGRIQRYVRTSGGWQANVIPLPDSGVASLVATSSSRDDLLVSFESAVQPTTLYYAPANGEIRAVASVDPLYDSTGIEIHQRHATSSDGERVPYFLIGHRDVIERGDAATILYGYGGFEIPVLPVYYQDPSRPQHGALAGKMWLSRGGVLALANLRGGGEFGPRWHQAALRENRQLAFDDYFAIADALVDSGVAARDRLGALGRSNGGLLLGVALTQRPELFTALDIGVPLLDMQRYSKLLAGASWMGEYGDPDVPADWAFIRQYSPYQNLDADQEYPRVLFYTSTKDDRVHPGHARKMAAKLEAYGQDFWYYENIEGGHGGTANQQQLAMRTALEYAYFIRMLMPERWRQAASGESKTAE